MPAAADDDRALFDGEGRNVSNGDDEKGVKVFTNGFSVCKFNNFKTDGSAGHNSLFPDADFFLMRAAEAYLMYAEADARQNNGTTTAQGTAYINALRTRANATTQTVYSLPSDPVMSGVVSSILRACVVQHLSVSATLVVMLITTGVGRVV